MLMEQATSEFYGVGAMTGGGNTDQAAKWPNEDQTLFRNPSSGLTCANILLSVVTLPEPCLYCTYQAINQYIELIDTSRSQAIK